MKRKSTKEIIMESLFELTETMPYNRITVRDIAANAGVSTVTFYKYFTGKEDLYKTATAEVGKLKIKAFSSTYTWYDFLTDTIRDNHNNKDLVTNITNRMDEYSDIVEILTDNNEKLIREYIAGNEGEAVLDENLLCQLRLYLYGTIHILINDIRSGMKQKPEVLARQIADAMPDLLKKHIPV